METHERKILKEEEVLGNYQRELYECKQIFVDVEEGGEKEGAETTEVCKALRVKGLIVRVRCNNARTLIVDRLPWTRRRLR